MSFVVSEIELTQELYNIINVYQDLKINSTVYFFYNDFSNIIKTQLLSFVNQTPLCDSYADLFDSYNAKYISQFAA